ncbi:hypothetical protein G7046_g9601 [Stylonectria norvegica]|nr:hypothetical protein G7046_g9601 [Stylonectria norvegica]
MTNWQELGEVPDSEDDDGFDSQHSGPVLSFAPGPAPTPRTGREDGGKEKTDSTDIWEVPHSSQELQQPNLPTVKPFLGISRRHSPPPATKPLPIAVDVPDSSPLSSACSDSSLPSVNHFSLTWASAERSPSQSTDRVLQQPVTDDDISRSYVELSSPPPVFAGGDEAPAPPQHPPKDRRATPLPSQELGHDVEEEYVARQAAVRYERELRTRKPIQEHPYLYEHAQYNKIMGEHGYRPERRVFEPEKRKRQQETLQGTSQDTSQDKDFEDDSQESAVHEVLDESQLNGLEEFREELDSLELLPSPSPLKTSPLNDRAGPSSQVSSTGETENTSLAGDDLPALEDLLSRPSRSIPRTVPKRKGSPPRSSIRKRPRLDIVDSDPLEPATRFRLVPPGLQDSPAAQRSLRRSPEPPESVIGPKLQPIQSPTPPPRRPSPPPLTTTPMARPLIIGSDSETEPDRAASPGSDSGDSESETESESGREIIHTVGRRIKGVLPASWLRLDQQAGRDKTAKDPHRRQAERSPQREQRRGVAQKSYATPRSSTAPQFLFDDDSDDEVSAPRRRTTDEVFDNQTRLVLQANPAITPIFEELASDDEAAVEYDDIDFMLPARKRQLKLSESFQSHTKRPKLTLHHTKPSSTQRQIQPKITNMFDGLKSTTSSSTRLVEKKRRAPISNRATKGTKRSRPRIANRPALAPRLSILDVVDSNAPRFIKIAARAATRQRGQGRSSPSRKVVQLATREDHLDAMSVLNDWRAGSIPQRQSVSAASKTKQSRTRLVKGPLMERSSNINRTPKRPLPSSSGQIRKLVKHVSNGGSVSYLPNSTSRTLFDTRPPARHAPLHRSHSGVARPALLELDEPANASNSAFNATKKRLDRLFRKERGGASTSSFLDMNGSIADIDLPGSPPPEEHPVPLRTVSELQQGPVKARYRKKNRPQHVDLEAPRYSHANDPIPVKVVSTAETVHVNPEGRRLQGLGPYGSQYTHHFEIFPLDSGVFFHESTLLGSGTLEKVWNDQYSKTLLEPRPRISFDLGDQTLRWGPWNAQVSSELGIVLDYVADQLEHPSIDNDSRDPGSALNAARFIQKYAIESLSFPEPTSSKSFVSRTLEALRSFDGRVKMSTATLSQSSTVARVYDQLLTVSLLVLRLCQTEASLNSELFSTEALLKDMAKTTISSLISAGVSQVERTYEDLHKTHFRERGLREDTPIFHSWVMAMKVLELAQIPRGSFWDVTYTVLVTPEAVASLDVQEQEAIWKNIFTLLPITEFNIKGMIISGRRHNTAVDGWALPQKLLKHVFELYKENMRQPPSFNNYCRALIGRCHYLVQQWGWRRCVPAVGVIFDFFGSQNLAHLRNEEVFKSPRFLEELSANPSLKVEPEDKCFHIFLKLVALTIKKLKDFGSSREIRNLVARIMPNHNRQYSKEHEIHERDLAALRNHHDLLCTLFWASPPEHRPGAKMIERLVVPATSHKEACLINLRAWNQLARFVVASGEASTAFKPFTQWRNNIFQQMIIQFDAVASDVENQLLSLPKVNNTTPVSKEMCTALVAINQKAILEVIQFSIAASLDTMNHAQNLEAGTFALNLLQLEQVFALYALRGDRLGATALQHSLATMNRFLSLLDDFEGDEDSQQSVCQVLNSAQGTDAIELFDDKVGNSFFTLTRRLIRNPSTLLSHLTPEEQAICMEQVVTTSARLIVRLNKDGIVRSLQMIFFERKYHLFDRGDFTFDQRRHFTLFVSSLQKYGYETRRDDEIDLHELWLLTLVTPLEQIAYQSQFAEQLILRNHHFLPGSFARLPINFDYKENLSLFKFSVSSMRTSLLRAAPTEKKMLKTEHAVRLKVAMDQMKRDLSDVAKVAPSEYVEFRNFVREIIALIGAHGHEICPVDDFFYHPSEFYSPAPQDPQLQVPIMVNYGLRLGDGDKKVAPQLFFFLLNNFKTAMANNTLGDEVSLLHKGMENPGIFGFILGKMIPASIEAAATNRAAIPLVDIYTEALERRLHRGILGQVLHEQDIPPLLATVKAIIHGFRTLGYPNIQLNVDDMHLLCQMMTLLNNLTVSIRFLHLRREYPVYAEVVPALKSVLSSLYEITKSTNINTSSGPLVLWPNHRADEHILSFRDNLLKDLEKYWVLENHQITIKAPGKDSGVYGPQSGGAAEGLGWTVEQLGEVLYDEIKKWNDWYEEVYGKGFVRTVPQLF